MSDLSPTSPLLSGRLTKHATGPQHVAILMATRNGGATIDAQLDSLAAQTHCDWSLIVSDDGSTDDTLERVADFARQNPNHRVVRLRGPGQGSALNFLSLLRAAGAAPYVAFCDQDDVWFSERLARGLTALEHVEGPAIHGGRTVITDHELLPLRLSRSFKKPPAFGNALMQNIAGGNTMLLNRAALDVLQPASRPIKRLIAHDWWAYQLVTAVGGQLIWDPQPLLLYRQHRQNQIGANDTCAASFRRACGLFSGRFSGWCQVQTEALLTQRHRMTDDAQAQLESFVALNGAGFISRIRRFSQGGFYRQTRRGTLALWVALAVGRL